MAPAQKAKALLLSITVLLLCGCTGRPLSEREIVRAVLFEQSGSAYTACLLMEDKEVPEGEHGYKTAAAQGQTPEQALQNAEDKLKGAAYYGLMDVAALPQRVDWALAVQIGELLYERAQPSPEISLFALGGLPASDLEEQAEILYEGMQGAERSYGLHCGLQQLFVREDGCILPIWQDSGYGCLVLPKEGKGLRIQEAASAQLITVLCGLSDRFDFTFAGENAAFQAKGRTTVQTGRDGTVVWLHLTDADFTLLTDALDDAQARAWLHRQWQQMFTLLAAQGDDPMRLSFWAACRYGPGRKVSNASLRVLFE